MAWHVMTWGGGQLRQVYGLDATDPDRIPSMDEKIKMSYDIFKIGGWVGGWVGRDAEQSRAVQCLMQISTVLSCLVLSCAVLSCVCVCVCVCCVSCGCVYCLCLYIIFVVELFV
jgi:hypothetical protein